MQIVQRVRFIMVIYTLLRSRLGSWYIEKVASAG